MRHLRQGFRALLLVSTIFVFSSPAFARPAKINPTVNTGSAVAPYSIANNNWALATNGKAVLGAKVGYAVVGQNFVMVYKDAGRLTVESIEKAIDTKGKSINGADAVVVYNIPSGDVTAAVGKKNIRRLVRSAAKGKSTSSKGFFTFNLGKLANGTHIPVLLGQDGKQLDRLVGWLIVGVDGSGNQYIGFGDLDASAGILGSPQLGVYTSTSYASDLPLLGISIQTLKRIPLLQ